MKQRAHLLLGGLVLALSFPAHGQGTFQNLDFESPILPLVHVGGPFDFVASSSAVPGWTLFLGTNQQSRVLFNNYFNGTATIGLLGPGLTNSFPTFPRIIDGAYTITLQAGADPRIPVDPPLLVAAMTQSSLVPVSARSMQLKAYTFSGPNGQFAVSLDGQIINMVVLSSTVNYTLYGGDITPYAGLNADLRIATLASPAFPFSSFAFDSIVFSDQVVPEPSVIALATLGALLLGWRLFSKLSQ